MKNGLIMCIAMACHEANRAWCMINEDYTQVPWEQAENWQRESAVKGVMFALENPDAPDSAQHDAWCQAKYQDGWKYGEVKNAEEKTHPCLVAFDKLPEFQQKKDKIFRAIVKAMGS